MKKKILIAVLVIGMIGTASAQISNNEVHWSFDDSSCPVSDSSGNNRDGTCFGNPSPGVSGIIDQAFGFDGDDYIESSYDPVINQDSLSVWFKTNTAQTGHIFGTSTEEFIIRVDSSSDTVTCYANDGSFQSVRTNANNYDDGERHHAACTIDTGNELVLYVDNQTIGSTSVGGVDKNINLLAGAREYQGSIDNHFTGDIDQAKHFSKVLTSSEVSQLYSEGTNSVPTFQSVARDPVDPKLNDLVDVEANISDDGSITSVTGEYDKDGVTQSSGDAFINTGGNTWRINDWINVDEADSTYEYTITAQDNDGATATYTDSFTVTDSSAGLKVAKPKNITYQDPAPYDVYLNNDNDSVENETASCTLYADGSNFTSFTLQEGGAHETGTLPNLGEGSHNFLASCTEDQGTSALTDVYREFDIDNTEPTLNITHPIGKLEIKNNIDLNYTVSDASSLDQCTYNIDGEANVTLSNCENTTFSRNEVGDHTVNLWATDAAGNTAYDSQLFTADYENTVELNDADTGSAIQDFSVVLQNGNTEGGSTSDGVYEFFTTEMPKGDVNMTLKSNGYQTRTIEFSNVDNTFELNQEYEMTRAGIYIDAVDEQTQEDLQFSFVARNSTVSYNQTNITEFDEDLRDLSGFPTGDVTLTVTHPDDTYRPRQYFLDINENSRTMLTAYLLKRGQGLFTSVEVVDGEQNAIQGALVNIQRLYGTQWKTVVQKETTSSGGQSFYLDPDISYRAYVTHPNYVGFQGTFSPANYQYEPLIIQLGTSGAYNFTTRWDSISYKIEPQTQSLEGEGSQTFNYTVMDSQNALTEFGLKFWHNGTVVSQDSVKDSPSGGTVSLTEALGNYSDGENVKVEGYFLSDQEYYSVNRTYVIRKGFDQGVFSINAIFYELKKSLGETGEAFLALIATFLTVLGTRKTQFTNATMDGALALLVLGIFTWKQMFPGFIFILTLLLLIGVWASRRV